MELSHWRLDEPVAASTFAPPPAVKEARPIPFGSLDATQPVETGAAPSPDRTTPAN